MQFFEIKTRLEGAIERKAGTPKDGTPFNLVQIQGWQGLCPGSKINEDHRYPKTDEGGVVCLECRTMFIPEDRYDRVQNGAVETMADFVAERFVAYTIKLEERKAAGI